MLPFPHEHDLLTHLRLQPHLLAWPPWKMDPPAQTLTSPPCAHAQTHTHTAAFLYKHPPHPIWALIHCLLSFLVWEFHPSWALTPTPWMLPSDVNTFCPLLGLWHPTLGHWGSSLHLSHTHTRNGRKKIAALPFLFLSRSIVILVFICRFKKTIRYGYKSFVRYTYCRYFSQSAGCLFFFFLRSAPLPLAVCGVLVPWSGIKPRAMAVKTPCPTSEPPGKSLPFHFS